MGQRVIYPVDLLDPERRVSWEQAARRNGEKLSAMVRRVVDAAVQRSPLDPELRGSIVSAPTQQLEPVSAPEHEHSPRRTPWGGRVCEGCGELL